MSNKILISIGKVRIEAKLLDTPTAQNVKDALPFGCKAQTLQGEVLIETPVMAELEDDAKDVVKAGELAFLTDVNSIAIGFGKTTIAEDEEIRLAAKTNIWAHAVTDVTLLKSCKNGDFVFIEML